MRSVSTRWYPRRIFFTRTCEIVVAQKAEYAPEIGEGVLVRFQQRLLHGVRVGPVKASPDAMLRIAKN